MFFFQQKIAVAIIKVKKQPITFSNPTPEALPVLTLGIYSKGQVRTRDNLAKFPTAREFTANYREGYDVVKGLVNDVSSQLDTKIIQFINACTFATL